MTQTTPQSEEAKALESDLKKLRAESTHALGTVAKEDEEALDEPITDEATMKKTIEADLAKLRSELTGTRTEY
jgi:hypothetical protein